MTTTAPVPSWGWVPSWWADRSTRHPGLHRFDKNQGSAQQRPEVGLPALAHVDSSIDHLAIRVVSNEPELLLLHTDEEPGSLSSGASCSGSPCCSSLASIATGRKARRIFRMTAP